MAVIALAVTAAVVFADVLDLLNRRSRHSA
jgi:hypothetical protein